MKLPKAIFFVLFLLYFTDYLFSQSQNEIRNNLNKLIYQQLDIDFKRSPGFLVGVIDKDSTFIFPFGTIIKDTIVLPSPDNLFEIGSLTNVFTARLVNILEKKNMLKKDISINNYLPDKFQNPTAQEVTIQQLLTHTSGLPRVPLGIGMTQKEDNQPYAFYTKEKLESYFRDYDFLIAEVGKYNYSHFAYALLELIIEYICQDKFENILQKELLKDDFSQTKINLSEEENALLVQGFDKSHAPTPPWRYASFASAVGLKSNMNDLIALVRAQIDTDIYDEMHQVLVPTGMKKNVFAGEGWHIIKNKKSYPIVLHTGATSGCRGYIAFVKETRTGVIVLSNSEYALRGLGYFILEELNNGFKKVKGK